MIEDAAEEAGARMVRFLEDGAIESINGKRIPVQIDTICVHGDSPSAVAMAKSVRQSLTDAGIEIKPCIKQWYLDHDGQQRRPLFASGDTALTVQFGTTISIALNNLVLGLGALVQDADINGVVATLPTYRSLLINYDPLVISQQDLITQLEPLVMRLGDPSSLPESANSKSWQIPICFDDEFSPDLGHVSDQLGMTSAEVINAFLEAEFHIYMLGFAPGQPYMGGLPEAMSVPRRKRPCPQIPKRIISHRNRHGDHLSCG